MVEVDAALGPQSVHRALEILTLVVEGGPLPLSDIARASGLPASTTLRMLRALETWNYVSRSKNGQYSVGQRFVQSRISGEGIRAEDLLDLSAPLMQRLTAQTMETSYLAVPGPARTCTFLREVQSSLPIRYVGFDGWEGRTVARDGSVTGEIIDGGTPDAGFLVMGAVDDPETITVIGAPVKDESGAVIAVLSIAGPSYRIGEDDQTRLGELVLKASLELSEQLLAR